MNPLSLGRQKRHERESEEKSYEVSGSGVTMKLTASGTASSPWLAKASGVPLSSPVQVDTADNDGPGTSE